MSFLKGRSGRIELSDIAARSLIVDICLQFDELHKDGQHKVAVVMQCAIYAKNENETKLFNVAASLVSFLYKTGAVAVKFQMAIRTNIATNMRNTYLLSK